MNHINQKQERKLRCLPRLTSFDENCQVKKTLLYSKNIDCLLLLITTQNRLYPIIWRWMGNEIFFEFKLPVVSFRWIHGLQEKSDHEFQ